MCENDSLWQRSGQGCPKMTPFGREAARVSIHTLRCKSTAPLQVMKGLIDGYFAETYVSDKWDRNEKRVDPASKWNEKDRLNFALNTSMHFGIHLVTIPHRFGWPKGDKLMTAAKFGNDCLINGHDANCPFFRDGPLHNLFPSFPPPPKKNRTEVAKSQKKKSKLKALFCGCFGEP